MNAIYLTLFISLGLAALGVLLFVFSNGQRDSDHADRLALLPLEDDDVTHSEDIRAIGDETPPTPPIDEVRHDG